MLKNHPGDEFLYTHRECASLDLKRELRFNSSSSSSSKSADYGNIAENTSFDNSKGVVDGGVIGVKKELVVIPLVMVFIEEGLRLEPVVNKQQNSTSGNVASLGSGKATSNKAKTVSVVNSHVCILTSAAVVFINMNVSITFHSMSLI